MIGLLSALVVAGDCPAIETGEARRWQITLDRVVRAVVVLRVASPRSFDNGTAGTSTATGFVIDEKLGLILTNRHVVDG